MTSGTYQVTTDVAISARITVSGDVTLLLGEGATLNATAGIQVQQGNTLTIDGKGSLIATAGSKGHAGIGGDGYGGKGGNIIINGGTITATGNKASNGGGGAGIGAGYGDNSGNYKSTFGNITITGGTITANGAYGAAGIGAGDDYSTCGNILICGGTVNATGGYWGAGIGTGSGFNAGTLSSICGSITITGGNITATKGVDPKSSSYTYTNKFYSIGAGNNGSCGTVTIGGADGAIKTSPYTINIVPATYVVSFNANGGTGSMSNQTFNIDFAKPLTRNTFTRDGYFFTGWSNSADGDVDYVNGQTVTNLASANGTKTLYAKWMSANELPEGMQVDADYRENETGFYYVNMPINAATTTVNINDFKFFPYKIYDDGGKSGNASKYQTGYLTIYSPSGYNVILNGKVLATKANYLVCLDVYDGSNSTESKLGQYNYANNISVSSTGSSITLYFNANGESFEGLELTVTTSIIDYTLTYNGIDEATFSTTNPSSYTVESDEITLVNPTCDGYTFLGWTYDGQTEPIESVTIPKGSTGNKEFTANWAKPLTNSDITIPDVPAQTYTGSAIEPIIVKDGDKTLVQGTDYTVACSNNINVGTATATITGIGNYAGTVEKTFTISAKALTAANVSDIPAQTYTGSAIEPEITVTDGENTLTLGTDYTVSYSDNTNVGTAKATITGKGNYSGTVEKTFTINKAMPAFVAPESQTIVSTQTLADVTLPEGYSFANAEQTLEVGENIVALNYNPDPDNYETVQGNMICRECGNNRCSQHTKYKWQRRQEIPREWHSDYRSRWREVRRNR